MFHRFTHRVYNVFQLERDGVQHGREPVEIGEREGCEQVVARWRTVPWNGYG
jgi:hypothetical protein